MNKSLLLLFFSCFLLLTACNKKDMVKDAETFAALKCKVDSIEAESQAGKLNFIETEDAKEPVFEEMDILRRRYRHEKQALDSLIEIKVKEMTCEW